MAAIVAAAALTITAPEAKTLRWASQGDILTFDPHSQNEGLNNTANSYIYEALLQYNEKFELEPGLATGGKKKSSGKGKASSSASAQSAPSESSDSDSDDSDTEEQDDDDFDPFDALKTAKP
jgi:ABC-type transport system substrate-binding protein